MFRYSGITEDIIREAKVTFEEAQDAILKLVSAETILVGHSLENDLHALKVTVKLFI